MKLPWIEEGEKVLGLHELKNNKELSAWLKSDGAFLGNPSKMPWCGDFVDTALERAIPNEPRSKALKLNPYWALNWNEFGVATDEYFGAVVTFKRPGGGHVGFVVGISTDGQYYLVLGGNQRNRVSRTWIAKGRHRALRWPSTYKNPRIPLPRIEKKTAASRNEA
ncbi:MAG TPA: TIGR02594 family protein [Rhizobium sp.]|nr:TIGR02594 family protein [Rhizobium sp.]